MKASLKFREEKQNPLLRAKIPLNILGFPFQSGVVAGESKELTLNLSTFFESGPSLKLSYRPNDSFNPFSLVIKTGTGPYGSPLSSSIHMSAEFNLLGRGGYGGQPLFMLHFKPRLGDFSLKKSQSSVLNERTVVSSEKIGVVLDDNGLVEQVDSPLANGTNGHNSFYGKKVSVWGSHSEAAKLFSGIFSGLDVAARTSLPVRKQTMVHFRWGLRVPAEMTNVNSFKRGIAFHRIPFLVMNKIGIEYVGDGRVTKETVWESKAPTLQGNGNAADLFVTVKRQLEVLQAENSSLRSAMEDLRRDIGDNARSFSPARGLGSVKYGEVERNGIDSSSGKRDRLKNSKKDSDFNVFSGKSTEANAHEELKKALNGAIGA